MNSTLLWRGLQREGVYRPAAGWTRLLVQVTIANVADIDLEAAVNRKYGTGCPGCGHLACTCPDAEKP